MKTEVLQVAREWLEECVRVATRNGVPEEADLEAAVLAHIDGEAARLAAAREEQREACARFAVYRHDVYGWSESEQRSIENAVRDTPLDATPLADELRTLRARVAELERDVLALTGPVTPEMLSRLSDVQAYVRSAEPLEHTRQVADLADAFEARAEKAEADLAAMTEQWKAELNHANAWMRKYQAAEAQVAAARAECAGLIGRPWSRWAGDAGRDVLRAMDEAAK